MKPGKIKALINSQTDLLLAALTAVMKRKTAGSVHRFRVLYKKTRAVVRTEVLASKKKSLIIPGRLKDWYRQLGVIRDIQLQLARVRKDTRTMQPDAEAVLVVLRKQLSSEWAVFSAMTAVDDGEKLIRSIMPGSSYHFTTRRVNTRIRTAWEQIGKELKSSRLTDARLHQVRKELKDLYYIGSFSKAWKKKILDASSWSMTGTRGMKKLLSDIGKYQDLATLINFAGQRSIRRFQAKQKSLLRKLALHWQSEKAGLRVQIVQQLKADRL